MKVYVRQPAAPPTTPLLRLDFDDADAARLSYTQLIQLCEIINLLNDEHHDQPTKDDAPCKPPKHEAARDVLSMIRRLPRSDA